MAPIRPARNVIPINSVARTADIQARVTPALWLLGSLKAVMPFEIASTPVSAVVPLEKAWRMRNTERLPSPRGGSSGGGGPARPRGHRYAHRKDVVRKEPRSRHLRGDLSEVVPGDDISSAAVGIGVD